MPARLAYVLVPSVSLICPKGAVMSGSIPLLEEKPLAVEEPKRDKPALWCRASGERLDKAAGDMSQWTPLWPGGVNLKGDG